MNEHNDTGDLSFSLNEHNDTGDLSFSLNEHNDTGDLSCSLNETTESYIEGGVVYFTFTFNERPLEHILDYVVRGRD